MKQLSVDQFPLLVVVLHVSIVCSAREEMAQAVQAVVSGVEDGALRVSDVTQQLLSSCLYTSASPDPELLIRTSGEVRLSDYMLWQVGIGESKAVEYELTTFKSQEYSLLIMDACFYVNIY